MFLQVIAPSRHVIERLTDPLTLIVFHSIILSYLISSCPSSLTLLTSFFSLSLLIWSTHDDHHDYTGNAAHFVAMTKDVKLDCRYVHTWRVLILILSLPSTSIALHSVWSFPFLSLYNPLWFPTSLAFYLLPLWHTHIHTHTHMIGSSNNTLTLSLILSPSLSFSHPWPLSLRTTPLSSLPPSHIRQVHWIDAIWWQWMEPKEVHRILGSARLTQTTGNSLLHFDTSP